MCLCLRIAKPPPQPFPAVRWWVVHCVADLSNGNKRKMSNASSDHVHLACLKANEFSDHKGIARLNYSSLRAEGYLNEAMVFA